MLQSNLKWTDGAEYLPPVDAHLIRSQCVAQTFKVQVMRPARRRGEAHRYPVVYATDGNQTFDMFKGISLLMQSGGDAPPFILVGIGYPGDSPRAGALLRGREFIFPGYPKLGRDPPDIEGVLLPEEGAKDSYGAAEFLKFLAHELLPMIDRTYETLPGDRTYFGHSAGGGFGIHALFSHVPALADGPGLTNDSRGAPLFRNYIISSPGLIYHGDLPGGERYEEYDFGLEEVRTFIASGRTLANTTLYMSVGSEEEFESEYAQWRLTSSFYRMAALMRSAVVPGLKLVTEVLPGATHMTAWPVAYIRGIQAVFCS